MGSIVLLFLAFLAFEFSCINAVPTSSRIVGGQDANVGQFPFQVSLQYENGFPNCGGSILNERFILTAAHCVIVGNGIETYPIQYYQVRVGSIQYSMGGQLLKLKRIIVDKAYDNVRFLNDLALLELEKPLEWSDYVKPIEMATEEVPPGENVIISGWGRLSGNGDFSKRLQWNTEKTLSFEDCGKAMQYADKSIICLQHKIQNGACFGDSGGPATYNGTLVGVAAFVVGEYYPDCGTNFPDGYTMVSYYRDWILKNMEL